MAGSGFAGAGLFCRGRFGGGALRRGGRRLVRCCGAGVGCGLALVGALRGGGGSRRAGVLRGGGVCPGGAVVWLAGSGFGGAGGSHRPSSGNAARSSSRTESGTDRSPRPFPTRTPGLYSPWKSEPPAAASPNRAAASAIFRRRAGSYSP